MRLSDNNFKELINYRILFQDQFFWESRKEYRKIIEDFLKSKVDSMTFFRQIGYLKENDKKNNKYN